MTNQEKHPADVLADLIDARVVWSSAGERDRNKHAAVMLRTIAPLENKVAALEAERDAFRAELDKLKEQATQPVAWQWRRKTDPWTREQTWTYPVFATTEDSEVRALYAAPQTTQPLLADPDGDALRTAVTLRMSLHPASPDCFEDGETPYTLAIVSDPPLEVKVPQSGDAIADMRAAIEKLAEKLQAQSMVLDAPYAGQPGWKLHRCVDGTQCRSYIPGGCAVGFCQHFGVATADPVSAPQPPQPLTAVQRFDAYARADKVMMVNGSKSWRDAIADEIERAHDIGKKDLSTNYDHRVFRYRGQGQD